MSKVCFVICWFGKLPSYTPIWLKTCQTNKDYDFLLLTDDNVEYSFPSNVKHIFFSKETFLQRVKERIDPKPNLQEAYRLCDFRPMYGVILKEEVAVYDYWGYCDLDVVFGDISKFLPIEEVYKYEAVFNGGHFSLVKNTEKMNHLYRAKGALFDYKTVVRKHAIFAFDETTGFQSIARKNKINARFGVPYIETESKYYQLRSRMEKSNPDNQAFYWENGKLFRTKESNGQVFLQELTYIHLQKRKLSLLDDNVAQSSSFWITPTGYLSKNYIGLPSVIDIKTINPYEGNKRLEKQAAEYRRLKIKQLLKRNSFQLYVRVRQQLAGINAGDGKRNEMEWVKS